MLNFGEFLLFLYNLSSDCGSRGLTVTHIVIVTIWHQQ